MNWKWKKRINTYKSVSPLTGPGAPCGGGLSGLCPLIIVFNFLVFNHLQFQNFQHIHHFQHPPRNFYIIPSKNFKHHEKILKHLLYQGLQTIWDIFDFPLKIKFLCRWFFFWRQKVHSLAHLQCHITCTGNWRQFRLVQAWFHNSPWQILNRNVIVQMEPRKWQQKATASEQIIFRKNYSKTVSSLTLAWSIYFQSKLCPKLTQFGVLCSKLEGQIYFAYSFLFIWILSVSNRTFSRLQALMISAGET